MIQQDVLDKLELPLEIMKILAEHSPLGIQIYNSDGFSIYVNEQFKRTYGTSPPPGYCVLKDEIAEAAGALDIVKKAFAGIACKGPVFWYDPRELKLSDPDEVECVKKYGRKCAIETTHVPVRDASGRIPYVVFFHRDVTAELLMRQERDDARKLVENILDQTPAVIYIKALDGKFLFVNAQFCRIFEKSREHVIGHTDYDFIAAEFADQYRKNDTRVLETRQHVETEEIALHADGSKHVYLSLKFPLEDSTGTVYGVCGISTDITHSRSLEKELGVARRMEAVGLLAGGIAHEFNNTLGIVLLVADTLLLRGAGKVRGMRAQIDSIRSAAQRASILIRQLLTFGRQQAANPHNVCLNDAILRVSEILSNALGEDIHLSMKIDPRTAAVFIDPMQAEQILINLCFNARDAMPSGGTLAISLGNDGDQVKLTVSDTGVGIDPAIIERIFEPFFTTKKETLGSGLGLSTVYGIVRSAQGKISVDSTPGKGTTFHILFPAAKAGSADGSRQFRERGELIRGTGTILLVEDQQALREVTAGLLRECGYTVHEARDQASAIATWNERSESLDMIITDIIMPGASGVETVQELEKKSGKRLKAIFVSAYKDKGVASSDLNRAGWCFIEKPYTADELLLRIHEALS